jgi:hypothetical protein
LFRWGTAATVWSRRGPDGMPVLPDGVTGRVAYLYHCPVRL